MERRYIQGAIFARFKLNCEIASAAQSLQPKPCNHHWQLLVTKSEVPLLSLSSFEEDQPAREPLPIRFHNLAVVVRAYRTIPESELCARGEGPNYTLGQTDFNCRLGPARNSVTF